MSYEEFEIIMGERKEVYNCLYTEEEIEIDGLLDKPVWRKAKTLNFIK